MAKIKLADACRRLSQKYETPVPYQTAYMAAVANIIPAERDNTGRFWLIDESNLTAMAKALGLATTKPKPKPATKPAGKPSAKPKPASKPAPSRPARSRVSRSTASAA
jgi:hypothetical protein